MSVSGMPYLAYGSNIDCQQMAIRCPNSKLVGKATLTGYRFIINEQGVASIIAEEGSKVEGLIRDLSPTDLKRLDRYEGLQVQLYEKCLVQISLENGNVVSAFAYVATNANRGTPRPGYLERIVENAEKHSFHSAYVSYLRSLL